jgi:hypothetical protein
LNLVNSVEPFQDILKQLSCGFLFCLALLPMIFHFEELQIHQSAINIDPLENGENCRNGQKFINCLVEDLNFY